MATATKQAEEGKLTFDDLFADGQPPEELKPDVIGDEVPLTDEERGAQAARDRLAERMGAKAEDISVVMEDIAKQLMEGGVVVDIDIHSWTGQVRLLPKELGLHRHRNKAIRLGEKLLIPPTIYRLLNSLRAQLRQNLTRHSIPTIWGPFVMPLAYAKWKPKHDQLAKEYEDLGNDVADNRDKILTETEGTWGELRRLYAENAREAWCRLNQLPVDDYHLEQCPAWFVSDYIEAIFTHMPSADEIRESFRVIAKISYIPLPSMLEEDRARSQRIWERAADEREADRRRREAQEAMEADIHSHYVGKKHEMIDSFLASLASAIYSRIYDATSRALATKARNQGKLLEPTLRQLRGLVEWGEAMNPADNQELEKALTDLQAMINQSAEQRSPDDIEQQLKAMGTVARSVLVDLNINPSIEDTKLSIAQRDAVLGIGKRLSRATVAKARDQLGTANIEELPVVRARRGSKVTAFQTIPQL